MKILSVQQIRDWDKFTIEKKPIASVDLMENAAMACAEWIRDHFRDNEILIISGKGNNGGDGLAIARLLNEYGLAVSIMILETGKSGSGDFEQNLRRLRNAPPVINSPDQQIPVSETTVIIDAMFGSGLTRPVEGIERSVIEKINATGKPVVSIDIPSGLFADRSSRGNIAVQAAHTLSFQSMKLAFMMAENAEYTGEIHLFDIGLEQEYLNQAETRNFVTDETIIREIYKSRNSFSHKGNFGHALLLAGSYGKMGAAVLAAKACSHAGSGLVTTYLPTCGNDIMQISIPEVMCMTGNGEKFLEDLPEDLDKYQAIGVGPGIGLEVATVNMLEQLLQRSDKPIVIDADALNIISENPRMLESIPELSVLTPHPKEFERLFGKTENEFERISLAVKKSTELKLVIVLKGHHTQVSLPDGRAYFNNTGNSGMAKGGSGDTLTGIITSLLGQGYEPGRAAMLGVYLHGLAGDLAAAKFGEESMLPVDLISSLGEAFTKIKMGTR